jgi:hypothetical protein
MRVLSERRLAVELGALAGTPRVVAGGNYATPWRPWQCSGFASSDGL